MIPRLFILISSLPTDLRAYCSIDNVAAGSSNGFWIDGGNDPIEKFSGNIVSILFQLFFFFNIPFKISHVTKTPHFLVSTRPTAMLMKVSSYTKGFTDPMLLLCSRTQSLSAITSRVSASILTKTLSSRDFC